LTSLQKFCEALFLTQKFFFLILLQITDRGGKGIAAYCDHSNPEDVKELFERIEKEQKGRLDILVNNAYSAVNLLTDTSGKKFYELEPEVWDQVNNVGLKNHYICSVYAARLMVPRKQGLIVNVSSFGGLRYTFNVAYGVGKAALDRMSGDIGHELRSKNVTCISLWPGAVKTEMIQQKILDKEDSSAFRATRDMFAQGESTEYAGRAVVHLASDPNVIRKSGRILMAADLGDEYGFTDVDGSKPINYRSVQGVLKLGHWDRLAGWVPAWVKFPTWLMAAQNSKL
jgi:dehydrogenase/reductase SDR family protein 1